MDSPTTSVATTNISRWEKWAPERATKKLIVYQVGVCTIDHQGILISKVTDPYFKPLVWMVFESDVGTHRLVTDLEKWTHIRFEGTRAGPEKKYWRLGVWTKNKSSYFDYSGERRTDRSSKVPCKSWVIKIAEDYLREVGREL